jgi:hypothetical protein
LNKIQKYHIKDGNVINIREDIQQLLGDSKTPEPIEIKTIVDDRAPTTSPPSTTIRESPRTIRTAPAQVSVIRLTLPDTNQHVTLKMFSNQTIAELLVHVDPLISPIVVKKGRQKYELRTAFQSGSYLSHQTLKECDLFPNARMHVQIK